jgi:hypothetical protein
MLEHVKLILLTTGGIDKAREDYLFLVVRYIELRISSLLNDSLTCESGCDPLCLGLVLRELASLGFYPQLLKLAPSPIFGSPSFPPFQGKNPLGGQSPLLVTEVIKGFRPDSLKCPKYRGNSIPCANCKWPFGIATHNFVDSMDRVLAGVKMPQ